MNQVPRQTLGPTDSVFMPPLPSHPGKLSTSKSSLHSLVYLTPYTFVWIYLFPPGLQAISPPPSDPFVSRYHQQEDPSNSLPGQHHDRDARNLVNKLLRGVVRPRLPSLRPISLAQTARRQLRGPEERTRPRPEDPRPHPARQGEGQSRIGLIWKGYTEKAIE